MKKTITVIICVTALIVAVFTSCGQTGNTEHPTVSPEFEAATGTPREDGTAEAITCEKFEFNFIITDSDSSNSYRICSTTGHLLGDAIGSLVAGKYNEDGTMTVKTVNGIEAPDNMVWNFYLDGEKQTGSPDIIEITNESTVEARLEKAE